MEDEGCLEAVSETLEEMVGSLDRLQRALNTTGLNHTEIEELLRITYKNLTRVQSVLESLSDKLRYASAHYFFAWLQLEQDHSSAMVTKAVINCMLACFGMLPTLVMYDGSWLLARLPQLKEKCLEVERTVQNQAELKLSRVTDIFEGYILRTEPVLELLNVSENLSPFQRICVQLATGESEGLSLECARQAYFA